MMPHHWRPLAHEQNSIFKCKQHTISPQVVVVDVKKWLYFKWFSHPSHCFLTSHKSKYSFYRLSTMSGTNRVPVSFHTRGAMWSHLGCLLTVVRMVSLRVVLASCRYSTIALYTEISAKQSCYKCMLFSSYFKNHSNT